MGCKIKKYYLYDARYNIKQEIEIKQLEEMGIMNTSTVRSYKTKINKIVKINKYIIDTDTPLKEIRALYEKEVFNNEIWRDLEGYDYKYKVSNYGRVKRVCAKKDRLLMPYGKTETTKRNNLRRFIGLYKDGKKREILISNLVAQLFLEKPNNSDTLRVMHLDGRIYNDYVGNLSYITQKEIGKMTGMVKAVSTYMVDPKNYEIINTYMSGRVAAKDNFVSSQTVFDSINLAYSKNVTGYAFIQEDEYYNFIDSLENKKYILYNSKTNEKEKGTLIDFHNKYGYDLHLMRFSFENKRTIPYSKVYILDPRFRSFEKLK